MGNARWWIVGLLLSSGCDVVFGLKPLRTSADASSKPLDASTDGALGPLDTGLVAHLTMDTVATGVPCLLDQTSYANNGSCLMGRPTKGPGKLGMAAVFVGATTVTIPLSDSLRGSGGFTFSAWLLVSINAEAACPFNRLLSSGNEDAWQLCMTVDGVASLDTITIDGTTPKDINTTTNLTPDTWYHYAITWDGVTVFAYLDGLALGSVASDLPLDGHELVLGSDLDPGGPGHFVTGRIDEVRIYDRALDPGEIIALTTYTGD